MDSEDSFNVGTQSLFILDKVEKKHHYQMWSKRDVGYSTFYEALLILPHLFL